MKIDVLKGLQDESIKDVKISAEVLSVKSDDNTVKHYRLVSLDAEVEDDKTAKSAHKEEPKKTKK